MSVKRGRLVSAQRAGSVVFDMQRYSLVGILHWFADPHIAHSIDALTIAHPRRGA
jgi:hypothetical protein